PNIVRPYIIKSQNVVGVAVSEENGVETIQAGTQGLLAKVGSRVDDHVLAIAGKQHGRAQALVARIRRATNAARATERRDAHRRSGAENGYFEWSARHCK